MSSFIQRYLAEKLSLQNSTGEIARLSSVLAKSTIDLNPHQIYAALYAFNSPLSRGCILADEVGLGKTIEAGIIIAQLWAEGKHKILVMCPSSLRKQWQDELLVKFGLESEIWDGPSYNGRSSTGQNIPLTYNGIFIVSYQFVYSHLELVSRQDWAVVIIDEAHRFRRVYRGRDASKMAFAIREVLQDKPKVLLTATPLQNNLEELYGIASFIDDKLLGTKYSFTSHYADPIRKNDETAPQKVKELRAILRGEEGNVLGVSGIINRTLRRQVLEYVPFTDRTSMTFDFTPSSEELELYDLVSAYLQRPRLAAIAATQRNLMVLVYRKLLASSSFAIGATLDRLAARLQKELNDQATIEPINPDELELVDDDETEKVATSSQHSNEFTKEEIQTELKELQDYATKAKAITDNTKGHALIRALNQLFTIAKEKNWPQKAVVFTESTRTQEYLASLLAKSGLTYTIFNGSNSDSTARLAYAKWAKQYPDSSTVGSYSANVRQALIEDFRHNNQVFLTTEAGAEGLNLQFCNLVINYDLPWNPQRVEQRIGRCHRYGQIYQVLVANFLNTKNYADQRVLKLLQEKLNLFDGLFGSSDEVLGALEDGVDFEKFILKIYQTCKTPDEYKKAFDKLQDSLRDVITSDMTKCREDLLDNTDQSVANLFRSTSVETNNVVSELDEDMKKLCLSTYKEFTYDSTADMYHSPDHSLPFAFRELTSAEIGKITRASLDFPLVTKAIVDGRSAPTGQISDLLFNLSTHQNQISELKPHMSKEGFIFLWKLIIAGVTRQERIIPLIMIKDELHYHPLSVQTATSLLTVDCMESGVYNDALPFSEDEFVSVWHEWKKPVMERYHKQNDRLYDREIDRINRYYDDYDLHVRDKLTKKQIEIAQLDSRRDNSSDLAERRLLQSKVQQIRVGINNLEIEQLKLKTESSDKRSTELADLEHKLEPKVEEHLLSIAHFSLA